MNEKPPDSSRLAGVFAQSKPDAKDETIAQLEQQLGDTTNALNEQRFLWILVVIILFDALIFSSMENWTGPIVIGVLEIIGIVILADRCKVDTVMPFIDRLTGLVHRAAKTNDESKE